MRFPLLLAFGVAIASLAGPGGPARAAQSYPPQVIPGLGPATNAPRTASYPAAPQTQWLASADARPNYGGGFLEMLVTGGQPQGSRVLYNAPPPPGAPAPRYAAYQPDARVGRAVDPQYARQQVAYSGPQAPGTIVIDTPNKFLYLVLGQGQALRYGIGVGRPGFEWSGVKTISRKAEWPAWTPPAEMLLRRPDLPRHMEGGPSNPLGSRAMYLGSSLYRIHGTNEPETIGTNVSSGCIRMLNEDVMDLYERVRVGTKVVVI
jgi:lipoprotein-anchoring transpeptidase ErfK/SrfK